MTLSHSRIQSANSLRCACRRQRCKIEEPAIRSVYPYVQKASALFQTSVRICTSAFSFNITCPDIPAYWLQTLRSCNETKTDQNRRNNSLDSDIKRQCRGSRGVMLSIECRELMCRISSASNVRSCHGFSLRLLTHVPVVEDRSQCRTERVLTWFLRIC